MVNLAAAVATVDDVQKRNMRQVLEAHKLSRQANLWNGGYRTYRPFTAGQENELPDQITHVQVIADTYFADVLGLLREMWDAAAVRDKSNMSASADVVVDGVTLIEGAPVPYLLYLDKQLASLAELVTAMPTRDPAERWEYDADSGTWRSAKPSTSHRVQKTDRVITLFAGNDQHPPQCQLHWEDVPVGEYTTVKTTGAWAATTRRELVDRIARLRDAVKIARTTANRAEAVDWHPATALAQYLFPAR